MVGRKASADGSVMTSHTCDSHDGGTQVVVVPAGKHDRGAEVLLSKRQEDNTGPMKRCSRKTTGNIPQVAETTLIGGTRRQIHVQLDAQRLASRNLSAGYLVPMLQQANAQAYTGAQSVANQEVLLQTGPVDIPTGTARLRYPVPFYLVAIFFLIFDVEGAYIFTWAVAYEDLGWPGWMQMSFFIVLLLIGLLYIWKKGGLDWRPAYQTK